MKRIFKILAIVVVSIVLIIASVITLLLARPEIVLNSRNLPRAQKYLEGIEGFRLTWLVGALEVESKSFSLKRVSIQFENLCIKIDTDGFNIVGGCFEKLNLNFEVQFNFKKWPQTFYITEIGPAQIHSQSFHVHLPPTTEEANDESPSSWKYWVNRKTKVREVTIKLQDARLITEDAEYKAKVRIDDAQKFPESQQWTVDVFAEVSEEKQKLEFQTDLKLSGNSGANSILTLDQPVSIRGPFNLSVGPDFRINSQINYESKSEADGVYKIDFDLRQSSFAARGHTSGNRHDDVFSGQIQSQLQLPQFDLNLGDQKKCEYTFGLEGALDLDCFLSPFPRLKRPLPVAVQKYIENLYLHLNAKIKTHPDSFTDGLHGYVDLTVEGEKNGPLQLAANLRTDFDNTSITAASLRKLKLRTKINVDVPKFAKTAHLLSDTPFAIPAPVNSLDGSLACAIDGEIEINRQKTPITCRTTLGSKDQSLVTSLTGTASLNEINKKLELLLDLNLRLDDVRIVLPRLSMSAPPPIIPDARLKKSFETALPSALPVRLSLRIYTTEGKPVFVSTNLAKEPIPIELDLKIVANKSANGGTTGVVRIREFPVEVLNRKARIKHFNINVAPDTSERIEGLVDVAQANYTIHIMIDGTVKEPRLRFESDPPLQEEDILSVLLYGQPAKALDANQSSSVANTRSAIADRAVALTSMYLLASTPIESVGYDSQAQIFTAKVKLQEGTSIDIGTDSDRLKQIGINRHLGGPWYIYTYFKNPTEKEDRSTAALLEWVLKY